MGDKIRVTVWNEGRHEKTNATVKKVYPKGMHRPSPTTSRPSPT